MESWNTITQKHSLQNVFLSRGLQPRSNLKQTQQFPQTHYYIRCHHFPLLTIRRPEYCITIDTSQVRVILIV